MSKRILLVLGCIAMALSCGSKPDLPEKIIFVGIDAADWDVMRPLLEEGKLPHFAKLLAQGATGRIETFIPLRKSPVLWTSIATSKLPDEHGIGGYIASTPSGEAVPYTGNTRRVKAIWNILSERGYKVAIVGWMVTWPAEEVNGYLVSDYIQYETEKKIKLERQTYPDSLFEEIDRLRVTKNDVTDEDIASIFPVDLDLERAGIAPWQKDYVKMIWATDETYRRIALYFNEKGVDFLAVYLNGIDSMGHAFWDYRKKEGHPLQHVIDNYYVWIDGVLGEFMDLVDDRTLLITCSDHGFHGPRRASDGSLLVGVYMHGRYGIVGLIGKGVNPGSRIVGAGILDITPTVLYAFGLPVARDMKGKVLTDAFEPDYLEAHPVTYIETYETGERVAGKPIKSPVDEKIKERLKALGYIQ